MIYEYAVDPSLLTSWVIANDVGLAPQFGLDHRRVVADFPSNWDGHATGALLEKFGWDDGDPDYLDARNRLDALLAFMRPRVHRGQVAARDSWVDQAVEAHGEEPFHAILTSNASTGNDAVITPAVVQDLRNQHWYLPTIDVTSKTAEALATQLAPLLRAASKIVLVDPYFRADKPGYPEVLGLLVQRALDMRSRGRPRPEITVMTGVGDREQPAAGVPLEEQLRREAAYRCRKAQQHLGVHLPKGIDVKFLCIARFEGGDQVHNRLLLTDVGGAIIPYGTQALGEQVFDDITPMYAGQYRTRWRQYGKGDGLSVVGEAIHVSGEMVELQTSNRD